MGDREKSKWKSTCIIIVITFLITPLIGFGATQNVTELPENVTLVENVPEFNEPQPENITDIPEPIITILSEPEDITNITEPIITILSELEDVTNITAPIITILSPENTTYTTTLIGLNYTINKPTDWVGYSLNGADNVTITGNITFYAPGGLNRLVLYAADTAGNSGAAEVQFNVNVTDSLGIRPKLSAKKDFFAVDEEPAFTFEYKTFNKSFIKNASAQTFNESFIGSISESESGIAALGEPQKAFKRWKTANETIEAFVYDYSGKLTDIVPEIERIQEGTFEIKLLKERAFRAGVYKLEVELVQDERVYVVEKEFPWGLISLNTRKSIYKPGETAEFIIVVLDEEGHSVCDANISMIVTNPNDEKTGYCTCAGTILPGDECGLYTAEYLTEVEGNHTVNVTASIGGVDVSFETNFSVQQNYEFDIIREAQSKIDPTKQDWFNVKIDIESFTDARSITLKEFVPAEFEISTTDATTVLGEDDTKTITWKKDLIDGNTSVSYSYSVPHVWPYLYALGPVEIEYNGNTFTEARAWYVAVDPTVKATSIEKYYFTLGVGVTSAYTPFAGDQTGVNAVPFATANLFDTEASTSTADSFDRNLPDIYFNSTGVIVERNSGTNSGINVSVSVLEFSPSSVKVQTGTFNLPASNISTTSSIGESVIISNSALIFYYKSTDTNDDYTDNAVRGTITGVNQLTFDVNAATATGIKSGHWYVFESLDGAFTVQNTTLTFASAATTATGTINSVQQNKTFLIASYITSETSDDPRDGSLWVNLTNSTTITGTRLGTPSATITATVYAITFSGSENVQRGYFSYSAGTGTDSDTIAAVDLDRAMPWNPVLTGRMADDSTSAAKESAFQLVNLTNSTTVQGTRAETTGNAEGGWEVIEWIINKVPTTPTSITCNGGSCNVTVDTPAVLQASGSTDADSDEITYFIEASLNNITTVQDTTNVQVTPEDPNIAATGGTTTESGGYTFHTFTSSGTFQVTSGSGNVELLVVGGGAGGGTGGTAGRGGGGAGGIVYSSAFPVSTGSYTVTVGGGGAPGADTSSTSGNGVNSSFNTLVAIGGGGAGPHATAGTAGGSGGGGSGYSGEAGGAGLQPGSASGGYGNAGGASYNGGAAPGRQGGGGGAGAAGQNGQSTSGGNGGVGLQFSQFASVGGSPAGWFGGGGGGGASSGQGAGSGGQGGGGAGSSSGVGTSGTPNTGGGGGGAISTGGSGGSGIVIVRYPTGGGKTSNDTNTTATTYQDVDSNYILINNITVKVEVDSYNPEASVQQSTNDPDLYLEMYNGSAWIGIGEFHLNESYTGDTLNTTNANFSLTTTDSTILTAWQTSTNQDLRIKGIYMDYYNATTIDEINYTNVWVTINGTSWTEIGNHSESTTLDWDTTDIAEQTCIDLRARAIDLAGSNTYSDYYTKGCCLNISHEAPTYSNDQDDSGGSVNEGTKVNVSVYWDDDVALSKGILRTNKTGTWQNETPWNDFTATPQWFNTTIDTSGCGGGTICWVQWANDTSDNWNTSMSTTAHCFNVIEVDSTPPLITDENLNRTELNTGETIRLNATTSDPESDVTSVEFSIKYSNGTSANFSATEISTNYWEYNFSDTAQPGQYNWTDTYATSAGGTNHTTPSLTFIVYDITPPVPSNMSTNETAAGSPCLFSAYWTDNVGLANYTFAWNDTGEWVNDSVVDFSGTGNWSNVTKPLNSTPKTIGWRIYANDTSGNRNDTGIQLLTLKDATKPVPSNISTNATAAKRPCLFSVYWTDNVGLANYTFAWNDTGEWVNESAVNFSGTGNWSNVTKPLNSTLKTIGWRIYANDTSGNQNDTGIQLLTIQVNEAPTTPTSITCDGGDCDVNIDTGVTLNASGSTDPDGDEITYFIEATLVNATIVQNTTDISLTAKGSGEISKAGTDTSTSSNTLTGLSWSHTLVSGTDRMVVVMIAWENANINTAVSGVTYGGHAMTQASAEASGNTGSGYEAACQIWYILEANLPSDGAKTVNVTMTGTASSLENDAIAMQFNGVAQSGTVEQSDADGATSGTTITSTISPSENSWVLSCFKAGNVVDVAQNEGQTEVLEFDDASSTSSYAEYGPATGSETSFSSTFTGTINRHARAAASFVSATGTSSETNTTTTTYDDVDSNYYSTINITVKVEVDSYNPEASVQQATNDPDLYLELYNGSAWIGIGEFHLNETYTGDSLDTTNHNFSLTTTDSTILTAWQTSTNQDLRIKGIYMDYYNSTTIDEINYTNVWVTINSKNWTEIGNHSESTTLDWNTTDIAELMCINLRARAIDLAGSNTYSDYYTKECCLNIYRWNDCNVTWISPSDPSEYTLGNTITLTCLVRDATTSAPIENYPVHFYNRTDGVTYEFGVNYTNSSGYAVMDWATTGVAEGWYYPKGNITDNATLLYHATAPYEANTSINLSYVKTLEIRNQAASQGITSINVSGSGGETIINPYNDVDGSGSAQNTGTTTPVVTIYNPPSSTEYKIWLKVEGGTGWDYIVTDEKFNVTADGTDPGDVSTWTSLRLGGSWGTFVDTGETVAQGTYKDLYLAFLLNGSGTGNATISVLGEVA
jgi:hypothetical protein